MVRRVVPLLVLLACLVLPASAAANAFTQVDAAYLAAGTGTIAPCEFSAATLEAALRQAPGYDYQYQSDFTDAVDAALSARAAGQCSHTHTRAGLGAGAHLASGVPGLPRSATAPGSGGLPLVLVLAVALVGVCALGGALFWAVNSLGVDPPLLRAARHSLAEAELRLGAGWEDLLDRLRR